MVAPPAAHVPDRHSEYLARYHAACGMDMVRLSLRESCVVQFSFSMVNSSPRDGTVPSPDWFALM